MAFINTPQTDEPSTATYVPVQSKIVENKPIDFPIGIFPTKIQKVIKDCNTFLSYHNDYIAASIFAAASCAIASTYRAQYQWQAGTGLYMAIVGKPGDGKTPPMEFAFYPMRDADKKAIAKYKAQMKEYNADNTLARPSLAQMLYGDTTIEAFTKGVSNNSRGISIFKDELSGFFQNFNRYNSGSDMGTWLEIWSGGTISINRSSGIPLYLENVNATIFGGIQHGIMDIFAKGGGAINGFIERFLFVKPSKIGIMKLKKRNERQNSDWSYMMGTYKPFIEKLLSLDMTIGEERTYVPNCIGFTHEADDLLTDWINVQKEKLDKLQNDNLRNIYSKMQTYCVRFSLTIHLMHYATGDANLECITLDSVEKAIILAEYFILQSLEVSDFITNMNPVDKLPENYKKLYRELPEEFETKDSLILGIKYNIPEITVKRLLSKWVENKICLRSRHGGYTKLLY